LKRGGSVISKCVAPMNKRGVTMSNPQESLPADKFDEIPMPPFVDKCKGVCP